MRRIYGGLIALTRCLAPFLLGFRLVENQLNWSYEFYRVVCYLMYLQRLFIIDITKAAAGLWFDRKIVLPTACYK